MEKLTKKSPLARNRATLQTESLYGDVTHSAWVAQLSMQPCINESNVNLGKLIQITKTVIKKNIYRYFLTETVNNIGKQRTEKLRNIIDRCGQRMINSENGKMYCVYEIVNINGIDGFGNCLCREFINGKPRGPIVVKNINEFESNYV